MPKARSAPLCTPVSDRKLGSRKQAMPVLLVGCPRFSWTRCWGESSLSVVLTLVSTIQVARQRRVMAGQRPSDEGLKSTPCCHSARRAERQQCSGSGHSRPQRELTVSATFRSSRRQRDRDADDRSQGSADVARRMCVARWFPERQLNRCRGHWASKTNRMSAAHGAGLTHPTLSSRSRFPKAARSTIQVSGPRPIASGRFPRPDDRARWGVHRLLAQHNPEVRPALRPHEDRPLRDGREGPLPDRRRDLPRVDDHRRLPRRRPAH
jgi:hypothetical protein